MTRDSLGGALATVCCGRSLSVIRVCNINTWNWLKSSEVIPTSSSSCCIWILVVASSTFNDVDLDTIDSFLWPVLISDMNFWTISRTPFGDELKI